MLGFTKTHCSANTAPSYLFYFKATCFDRYEAFSANPQNQVKNVIIFNLCETSLVYPNPQSPIRRWNFQARIF
jgi:hypothetical protein